MCVREHLLIWKMKALGGGALPSNASYQRLNTEQRGVKRCTTSRLPIDTSDYPGTEQAGAKVQERWLQRQSQKVPERRKDGIKRRGGRR